MPIRAAFIAVLSASVTVAGAEPLVRHAGEWETTVDNGKPIILCFPSDVTLDQNYVLQSMSRLAGAECTVTNSDNPAFRQSHMSNSGTTTPPSGRAAESTATSIGHEPEGLD
jgi:hypothetical protein